MLRDLQSFYDPDLEPLFFRSGNDGLGDYSGGFTSPVTEYEPSPSPFTTAPITSAPVVDPLPTSVLSVSGQSEGGETVSERETVSIPVQETESAQFLSGVTSQSQKRAATQVDPLLLMAGLGFAGLILIGRFSS